MTPDARPITVALLGTPEVSADGRPFNAGNGVRITPDASFADCPHPDVICITDLLIPPDDPTPPYAAEVVWLRSAWQAGATVGSACSGAQLLAGTGLHDDCDATSHWAYCDRLALEHPRTRWHPDRGLVLAGPESRIVMAGSGVARHMLVLALIARIASPQDAMHVARINLLDLNQTSALAYASLTRGGRAADELMARCQLWAASNNRSESPVAQMVALSGVPECTFKRRSQQATAMSPLDHVHTMRLEEAKQMLESTALPVEAIAEEVGYQEVSFFGRLFKRKVALTPAQYRRRFGAQGAQLRSVARAGS